MIRKKGLSTVVTTLIIILLVLVAIGIVWVVISNLIQEGSQQIFLDKFTTDLKIKNVNVDNSTNSANVDIKRNAGKGDLAGIKFIFNDGHNSETLDVTNITLQELGEKKFSLSLNTLNIGNVQTVSIAPLYNSDSGKIITGSIISTYRISGAGILGTCVVDCSGKVCGSDSCTGTCGSCGTGYHCSTDQTQCLVDNQPCTLTSAVWSNASVVQYNPIDMIIQGNNCNGKDIQFTVYEYDGVGNDYITNMTVPFPPSGLSASGTWYSDYQTGDVLYNNQYYFVASVVGETGTITSSSPRLVVTQAPQTCAAQNGYICTGTQTCGGTLLTASDSNSCCDQPCTTPTQTCSAQGGTICTGTQTCSGSYIPASDSSTCCPSGQTCTTPVQTCSAQGGTICTTDETCTGTFISASDSARCCPSSQTCNPIYPASYIIRGMPTTVSRNQQVTVTLDIYTNPSTERLFALEERIPSGWTVVSNDFSGNTPDPLILRSYQTQGYCCIPSAIHFSYVVQAPSTAGTSNFGGIYVFESGVVIVPSTPGTNCGNSVCEQTSDKSQDELNSANGAYCPQDCQGDPIFGPTSITVN